MFDVFKIKRVFSLKPALMVMLLFVIFNIGRMFPSTPCLNPQNMEKDIGSLHKLVVGRQVKAQQLANSESHLDNKDSVNGLDNDHIDFMNAKDNNIKPTKSPNSIVEKSKTMNKQVVVPEETKKITKKPGIPSIVSSKIQANVKKTENNTKLPAAKPRSPSAHTFTDYYSTGSQAHHIGLKRWGYSSISKHSFKSPYIIDPHIYSKVTIIKPPGYRKKKLIACYNCPQRFFLSNKFNNDFQRCPYSECELSQKSGMNEKADMMLFWQDPGIQTPPPRPMGQLWTFVSWESPPNRAFPRPIKNWHDVFNYTISYLRDADFQLPYDNLVWRDEALLHPDQYYIDAAKRKTKTAAWWVSHCKTNSKRQEYVEEMKKYIPDIDIYGACGSLVCPTGHNDECWKSLNTTYRFYLSFENTFCPEYVTEKFYKAFRYRYPVIPVVRGGFEYNKHFPKNILINAANFASAKELAFYLIGLSKDPVRLGKMYKDKDRFAILNRKMDWCDFCEKMHTGGFKRQVIHDVIKYSHSRPCWDAPNDIK